MPSFSAHERTAWYFNETAFGSPPASWDASGIAFFCVDPSVEQLVDAQLENMNYRQRALATKALVRSLRNGTIGFGVYGRGSGVTTAEDSAGATYPLADFLKNSWGGQDLGYATGIAGGTAAAPDVDLGEGTNYTDGDIGFFVDATTGNGEFVPIDSVTTDTLTLRWSLSFTPDGGGADSIGAVMMAYFDTDALINRADTNHLTQAFYFQGDHAEDLFECLGVKLNLTAIEGLAPGEAPICRFEGMCRTHTLPQSLSQLTLDTPTGAPPLSTAVGTTTSVIMADYGSPPADVEAQGFTITPGVASQPINGLAAHGRIGYTLAQGSADAGLITVRVPYDNSWFTDYANDTHKHVLIQIGASRGEALGIYAPYCQIAENPVRGVADDVATIDLKLRPLEDPLVTAETGNQLELVRSKLKIVCAM